MNLTNSRRSFIRDTSLTATGLFFVSITGNNHKALKELAIGCAPTKPTQLYGSIGSIKSGNWSDPATWGGRVPSETDTPLITSGHQVNYDVTTTTIAGININSGGSLVFDPSKTVSLQTKNNIVVQGTLVMRPNSASQVHTLRFIGIKEDNFIGGGMDVLTSDVGLWVMAAGRLDIKGADKTSWTRVTDTVAAGSASFSLKSNPIGWAVGDEIVLVPTSKPKEDSLSYDSQRMVVDDLFAKNFEKRTISSISGTSVSVNTAFTYNTHEKVVAPDGPTWTAEILNLNRNVRIEGTATGRSHILIRSSVPQTLQNAAIRYMGPRKNQVTQRGDMISGRYAIHFHHCLYGSKGSQVTGNVVYDCGNHGYVPHVSHGINMSNNVSYNCAEIAFWWDMNHMTHYTTWNNNLIANNYHVPKTADMTSTDSPIIGGGMFLGRGDGNVAIGNVCVYAGLGNPQSKGAYTWEATNDHGVWVFENNLAHSNHNAIRVWQNTARNHTLMNTECYNNVRHLFHGAYVNPYYFRGGYFYDGETVIKGSSANSARIRFDNVKFVQRNNLPHCIIAMRSAIPTGDQEEILFLNCVFKGFTSSAIRNEAGGLLDSSGNLMNQRKGIAMVMCDFGGGQPWSFVYNSAAADAITHPEGWFRIQPKSGQSQMIIKGTGPSPIIKNIPAFYPTINGVGNGLKAEYFNNDTFGDKAFERTDNMVMFSMWARDGADYGLPLSVHHLITTAKHSVRWTGKVLAQYSEAYTFRIMAAGGYRLWIDGKMILDEWYEKHDDKGVFYSTPTKLVAGQQHDIKMEYFSSVDHSNAQLLWKCASMEAEILVHQAQLYSGNVDGSTSGDTTNKVPIANAGPDITITLPTNIATLNGSLSSDADGGITSYSWTKVNGPAQFTLSNANSASASVSNLVAGIYTFKLEVKDTKGATATDEVVVVVNEALVNKGPIAHAGSDITLVYPNNSTTLDGSASNDPDGTIASYKWTKISGPSQFVMANPTSVTSGLSNLVLGTYTFRLEVKDNKGTVATDDVVVVVTETANRGPVAQAGSDINLTLPMNSTTLNGSGSTDPDGSIAFYKWTKISGPSQYIIGNSNTATTSLTNLIEGTYVFRLEVKDNKGAVATDDVVINVNSNVADSTTSSEYLTLIVGPNPSTTEFTLKVTTTSKATIDIIVYDQWYKEVAKYKQVASGFTVKVGSAWRPGTYFVYATRGEVKKRATLLKLPS